MAELDDIYNTKILELAAAIPRAGRLDSPAGHGEAHSKLCGSTVSVDINLRPECESLPSWPGFRVHRRPGNRRYERG